MGFPDTTDRQRRIGAFLMETFRDLCIHGSPEQLGAAMKDIEQSLPDGWVRAGDVEAQVRAAGPESESIYCFRLKHSDFLPAATVFLVGGTSGPLYVSNVVPVGKDSLSHDEYNGIVEHFCRDIVRPLADRHGLSVEMTGGRNDLDDYMSDLTARKLRLFLLAANKNTGSAHPSDHNRWVDFIMAAHKEGSRIDASTLRRWLVEEEKWPWETADQLAAEYEFSRELLTYYDRAGKGA